ncbi:MAG: SDR family NAD(P)-dependent oxidoreductase [Kofleriaceae bacterium]
MVDLAKPATVRAFTQAWPADRPLHLLVNNAGIMACPLTRVGPGWEAQLAVNHLGHTALTIGLLPALRRTEGARVVALSSVAHRLASVDLDDLHFERRPYDKWKAYGQSKSANALMTLALDTRFAGDGLTANAVHPGGIITGLQQHLPVEEQRRLGFLEEDGSPSARFKTVAQGASTTAWAATAPELAGVGGRYLEDCREACRRSPAIAIDYAAHIMDRELADRLWVASERLLADA